MLTFLVLWSELYIACEVCSVQQRLTNWFDSAPWSPADSDRLHWTLTGPVIFKRLWKIKQIIFLITICLLDLNQFWNNLHFSWQFRQKYLPGLFSWVWNLWTWEKQEFSNARVFLPDSHAFDFIEGSLSQMLSQCYHWDTILLEGCFVFVWQPAGFTGKRTALFFRPFKRIFLFNFV